MMKKQQAGFTLIELIMVIVILGILSAFALPRFADLGSEAREAALDGGIGSVRSAAAIAHSAWLAGGSAGNVDLEGVTITMSAEGYPVAESTDVATTFSIFDAAQLDAAYGRAAGADATQVTISLQANCQFVYDENTGQVTGRTVTGC